MNFCRLGLDPHMNSVCYFRETAFTRSREFEVFLLDIELHYFKKPYL